MSLAQRCLSEVLLSSEDRRPGLRAAASCNTLGVPGLRISATERGNRERDSIARTGSGAPLLRDQDRDMPSSAVLNLQGSPET